MRLSKALILIAIAMLISAAMAAAQTTTGTITGHIRDSDGLPVAGATITLDGPALQGRHRVVSSENGDYTIPLLPPGTYTVTFEVTGFQKQERTVSVQPRERPPCRGHAASGFGQRSRRRLRIGTTSASHIPSFPPRFPPGSRKPSSVIPDMWTIDARCRRIAIRPH